MIFWDCAAPYKSRCQKWTQAHLYRRRYDRHSFGVSVSKQNVKSFENITQPALKAFNKIKNFNPWELPNVGSRCQTPSYQMHINLSLQIYEKDFSLSCHHRQTSPDSSLGKEGSKLTQALFTILWSTSTHPLAREGLLGAIFSHSFWRVAWELFHGSKFCGWNLKLQDSESLSQDGGLGT